MLPRAPKPSTLHRLTQLIFLVFMSWVGLRFILFALWAMGSRSDYVPKPPSVEAFLPISALMALKRFLFTGAWDPVHPAGLSILLLALLTSLLLRKTFCGYLCPIGTVSFWLFRFGRKLGVACRIPHRLAWLFVLPKYLLLAFFLNITLLSFDPGATEAFLFSHYNMVADTKMLLFFSHPGLVLIGTLVFLAAGSLVIPSFWCRCFCPYGALLGLMSFFSPLAVKRNESACLRCGKCAGACPQGIAVDQMLRISSPECIGCQECLAACPRRDCLSMSAGYGRKSRRLHAYFLPVATVFAVAVMYASANLSGHWTSSIPLEMVRPLHQSIDTLRHY